MLGGDTIWSEELYFRRTSRGGGWVRGFQWVARGRLLYDAAQKIFSIWWAPVLQSKAKMASYVWRERHSSLYRYWASAHLQDALHKNSPILNAKSCIFLNFLNIWPYLWFFRSISLKVMALFLTVSRLNNFQVHMTEIYGVVSYSRCWTVFRSIWQKVLA